MTGAAHPHPLSDLPCHDPYVLAVADGYLLYTAFDSAHWERCVPEGADYLAPTGTGVLAWWSPDLRTGGSPRVVFTVPPGCWADPERAPWAPEVHRWDGRYVLATTLHDPARALPPVSQRGTTLLIGSTLGPEPGPSAQGTGLAVCDDPAGPLELLDPQSSHTPPEFMALDGTLVRDESGTAWLVYAHEWAQILDGTIEAVPLDAGLAPAGAPVHLFRGSEASWYRELVPSAQALAPM